MRYKAVDIGELLDRLAERRNGLNIVILDACRNNPYQADPRTANFGLANMQAPALSLSQRERTRGEAGRSEAPQGTLVAYATAPDAIAYDGNASNSLYTGTLPTHIETLGLPLELLFKRVRPAARRMTYRFLGKTAASLGIFVLLAERTAVVLLTALPPTKTP